MRALFSIPSQTPHKMTVTHCGGNRTAAKRRAGGPVPLQTLFERERELHAVELFLNDLRRGQGRVVVIESAAGLGKTALARHTRAAARGHGLTVLSARGAEMEEDFPFGIVRQLFEPVLLAARPRGARLFVGAARATEPLFAPESPAKPPDSLHLLLNGLYWLLVNLTARTPALVLVDDLQWADQPSARFLGFLARRLDSLSVGVVVTARSGGRQHHESLDEILAAGDTTLLEPRGLSPAVIAELAQQELGEACDAQFATACHAATAGNPLLLRELLRILAADAVRPTAAQAAAVPAAGPNAVRRLITARLRRQSAAARRLALSAAVLGDGADPDLLARHAGLDPGSAAAAAESLARDGVFDQAESPGFTHAVIREVVLHLAPPAARSAEHERAAELLIAGGRPAHLVASHLLRTRPAGHAERITPLLAAADETRRRGSPGGAAVYLQRARDEPPPPEQASEISRLLGTCRAHDLDLARAREELTRAMALATDPQQRALCAYSLARFHGATGAPSQAVDLLEAALSDLAVSRPGPPRSLVAHLEAELVGVARAALDRRGDLLAHLSVLREDAAAPPGVVEAQSSAEALFAGENRDTVAARALGALAGGRLPPDRSAMWTAVHPLIVADRLPDAGSALDRALDESVRRGLLFPASLVRAYLARLAFLRGDLPGAQAHLEAGMVGVAAPNGALPVLQATSVHLLLEAGRLDQAEAVIAGSCLANARAPDTVWQLWLLGARTRLHSAQHRAEAVLADSASIRDAYRRWGAEDMLELPWRLDAARAHFRTGEAGRATVLVAEHLRLARAFGVPRYIAAGLCAQARLGVEPPRAAALTAQAVELYEHSPARLDLVYALEQHSHILARLDRRAAALAALERAGRLAAECGAETTGSRLHAAIVAAGSRSPRAQASGVHAFTPAERQVTRLAADGLTNREIAEKLFLSEKTIEAHLSHAYRKIGVRSRTELARQLARSN
jgi:DNA-binding CsgD family transcriptional regulator